MREQRQRRTYTILLQFPTNQLTGREGGQAGQHVAYGCHVAESWSERAWSRHSTETVTENSLT